MNQFSVELIRECNSGSKMAVDGIRDVMDDVTTSVDAVDATQQGHMFDILGRQVDKNYRGIIIQNGQRFLLQ